MEASSTTSTVIGGELSGEVLSKEEVYKAAARLVVFGIKGKSAHLNKHARNLLRNGAGGVILFSRNCRDQKQLAALCSNLKREAGNRPLLIMVDQEGGKVSRFGPPFTAVPSARVVGNTEDTEVAGQVGRLLGAELRAVHVDMNLAPVMDVDTNPDNPVIAERSFGRTPEVVSKMGFAFIREMQKEGVAACAKHFPGHGDTHQDSHLVLPRLEHSLERLEAVELPPFAEAVAADVAAIMVAHIAVPALEARPSSDQSAVSTSKLHKDSKPMPTTMSPGTIGYLRDQLRFDGLIMSDCLEMGAIVNEFQVPEAAVRSLLAGVDVLLVCHKERRQVGAIDAIVEAVLSGRVPYARVLEANKRLMAVLNTYVEPAPKVDDPMEQSFHEARLHVVGCTEHKDVVKGILKHAKQSSTGAGQAKVHDDGARLSAVVAWGQQ